MWERKQGSTNRQGNTHEWIARGEELRTRRLFRGLGLREAAELWGMKPSELLDIENGNVDNLTWEPPEK